jgi:chemotaxis protein methyltransferase CheR
VSEAALRAIERCVNAHAGLALPAWVLASRVRDRVAALALRDADEYLALLEGAAGAAELERLAESLRVGETSFFRHAAHVNALTRVVLPELIARRARDKRLRAWSAGCATGEEAYTLAILLGEGAPAGWTVTVLGSDLSEDAIVLARAGVYDESALERVPPATRARCFVPGPLPGTARVAPEIAARVRFERRNLLEPVYPRQLDVILCRNVLIYFDAAARQATVERLIESLAPGGYLFLGYAETLRGFERLEALRTDDGIVYRREARGHRPTLPKSAASAAPAPRPRPRPTPRVTLPEPPRPRPQTARGPGRLALSGKLEDPGQVAAAISRAMAEAGERLVVDLDDASFLAEGVAPVLRRAAAAATAAGMIFELAATRPGARRWLARHGLAGAGS